MTASSQIEAINYQIARFSTSAARLRECPDDSLVEVAFAGRSNAGKSSAINAITSQNRLARISKTPGRTQLINFFSLDQGRYLVDLPGYGYAKVPLSVKEKWQKELEDYLRKREQLAGLVLLSDIRHPLKEFDRMMIAWAEQSELPVLLLLTKADKLKRGAAQNTLLTVKKELANSALTTVLLFSAVAHQGIDSARQHLDGWLQLAEINDEEFDLGVSDDSL